MLSLALLHAGVMSVLFYAVLMLWWCCGSAVVVL